MNFEKKKDMPGIARITAINVLKTLELHNFERHIDMVFFEKKEEMLDERDEALAKALIVTSLKNLLLIEYNLRPFLKYELNQGNPIIKWILTIAITQLLFFDSVPDYAALNDSILLCRWFNLSKKEAFVNGVLREWLRSRDENSLPEPPQKINTLYSHPPMLTHKFETDFGTETAEQILKWNNLQDQQYARIRIFSDDVNSLIENNILVRTENLQDDIYEILEMGNLLHSPAMRNGDIYIMRPWSALVAKETPLIKGGKFLDMCAAPGGKAIAIYDRCISENKPMEIIAIDSSERRLKTMKVNLKRSKIKEIKIAVLDALEAQAHFGSDSLDVILLDAPCSSLGMIRRDPEIRWRNCLAEMESLIGVQRALFEEAACMVKPGGYIVYSVCSFMLEETIAQREYFSQKYHSLQFIKEQHNCSGQNGYDGGYFLIMQKKTKNN